MVKVVIGIGIIIASFIYIMVNHDKSMMENLREKGMKETGEKRTGGSTGTGGRNAGRTAPEGGGRSGIANRCRASRATRATNVTSGCQASKQ